MRIDDPPDDVVGTLVSRVFEVRFDDEESYHVVARFTDKARGDRLRDRLFEAHTAADKDGCDLSDSWQVVRVELDDVDPETPLPDDLFWPTREYDDHHAMPNIDRLDLSFLPTLQESPGMEEPKP